MKNNQKNYWILAAIFMVAKICIHLFSAGVYELHRDEMLYFNMASHPAFGYLTVPPVTGILAFVVKSVFGWSVAGIRLLPALFGAATLYLVARFIFEMKGGITALLVASIAFLASPGFLLLFSVFTPNAFEVFFWTLAIFFIFKLIKTENPKNWMLIGAVLGISFLTKYSVLFLIAGFFLVLLFSKQRKLLFSWWFAAGILIGFLIILPNIIWQYNHNWPVQFHFEELKKTQLDNLKYSHFFIDLFSLNSVLILVPVFGLTMLIFSKKEPAFKLTGLSVLLVFLLFVATKGKAYYITGLLPFLVAAGGFFAEKLVRRKTILFSGLAILTIWTLLSFPFVIPTLSFEKLEKYSAKTKGWVAAPFMRWEDGNEHRVSQIYADMTGWKEMAILAGRAFNLLSEEEKKRCTVFCERNYGYAGAIHLYGEKFGLPQPITYHESYIFWAPDTIPLGPAIFINYKPGGMKDIFGEVTEIGTVSNPYFREKGVKVFLCRNPKPDVHNIYKTEIQKERKRFTRDN
jgi:MFS family permease